jgi:hypothetical protein
LTFDISACVSWGMSTPRDILSRCSSCFHLNCLCLFLYCATRSDSNICLFWGRLEWIRAGSGSTFFARLTCTTSSLESCLFASSTGPCSGILVSCRPPNSRVRDSFQKAITDRFPFSPGWSWE